MNHLCGFKVQTCLADISNEDALQLKLFCNEYNSHRPNNYEDEEPRWLLLDEPSDEWRPLDNVTLYRFLCADVENGILKPDESLERLMRTLRFRKENQVDSLLRAMTSSTTTEEEKNNERKSVLLVSGNWSECGSMVNSAIHQQPQIQYGESSTMVLPNLDKYQRLRIRVFTGSCHSGQPVMFERLGDFLGSGNQIHFSDDEWFQFYVWDMERHFIEMRRRSSETGIPIRQYVFCGDCHGTIAAILNRSIWKVIPLLKKLKTIEEYYPEIVSRIILFRVPRIATLFYQTVRGFLDPVTAAKITLRSGVPTDEFLKIMPSKAIPQEYGGTSPVAFPKTAFS